MSRSPSPGLHNVPWPLRIGALLLLICFGGGVGLHMAHQSDPGNRTGLLGMVYGKEDQSDDPPASGGRQYTSAERRTCLQSGNVVGTLRYDTHTKQWASTVRIWTRSGSSGGMAGKVTLTPVGNQRRTVGWKVDDPKLVVCRVEVSTLTEDDVRRTQSDNVYTQYGSYTVPQAKRTIAEARILGYTDELPKGKGAPMFATAH